MKIRTPHKIFFVVATLFVFYTIFIVSFKTSGRVEARGNNRFELVEKEDFNGFSVFLIKDKTTGNCYMNSGTTSSNTTLLVKCE
jgi:ABC-type glycerol-3-phosphate transport system permease component